MSVRPFDWRDLPALHRYRHDSIFLNSELVLTRGPLLLTGTLLSYLAPAIGIYTVVSNCQGDSLDALIGQMMEGNGDHNSYLTFLTPQSALETNGLPEVLEALAKAAGERGSLRLLADVDEHSPAFEALRYASFSIYARQRIWSFTNIEDETQTGSAWRGASNQDIISIRSLYYNVVPGLVQQVEPFTAQQPKGMVYRGDNELLAFVELKYGYRGIWANPFIHPDVEDARPWLADLTRNLPFRRGRPVYICVRSYQSWLEPALESLGADAGPRQAVMAKHLAIPQRAVRVFTLPALEGGHPEVSAPIARSETK